MSAIEVNVFRQALLDKRERVEHALAHLHREHHLLSEEEETAELVSGSADNHPADTATETFDRELDFTLEEVDEQLLEAIDSALRKIDEGMYGICERCGREIAPERLEAVPWATLCIDCKRDEERLRG